MIKSALRFVRAITGIDGLRSAFKPLRATDETATNAQSFTDHRKQVGTDTLIRAYTNYRRFGFFLLAAHAYGWLALAKARDILSSLSPFAYIIITLVLYLVAAHRAWQIRAQRFLPMIDFLSAVTATPSEIIIRKLRRTHAKNTK